jgi:hypothetical protein
VIDQRRAACLETSRWSDTACPVLDDPTAEHNTWCDRFLRTIEERDREHQRDAVATARSSVYHRRVPTLIIDVYRVLWAFKVDDPCIAHAVKKLLCAGLRGGGKSLKQDVAEAIWSLRRWEEMRAEEAGTQNLGPPP